MRIKIGRQKEMKRKTGLSLMLALLMILSTIVVVTPSGASSEIFVVEKQVSNGEGWHDSIHAVYGDVVQFKITITYNGEDCVKNIVATDTLPPCLEYVETLEPEDIEPIMNGNVLVWDLGETYLEQYCSTDIIFEAKVVGIGENINTVNVTAVECCPDHNIYGVATATVIVDPSVDVEKKVWDPDTKAWADELGWVIKGQNVRFQITSTYHGNISMKCMLVEDYLPGCCLEYANNVYIEIAGEEINENDARYPDIKVIDNTVQFDWKNVKFYLENGESVVIEFDAKVINYCERTVENWACAFLWGCYLCNPDNHVCDWDSATIQCFPHDLIFEKKVWDEEKQEWTEETFAYVGETVRFKIELVYYGNYNLTNVKIIDYLPKDILVYANEANIKPSNVSEDGKTIWWNLTKAVEDGVPLIIEFDALVIGSTGNCSCCGTNKATYTAIENKTQIPYEGEDLAEIKSAYEPEPEVELTIKMPRRIFFGKICATIENTGDINLNNVYWEISLTTGLVLKKDLKRNGIIASLEINKCKQVCTGKSFGSSSIKFKFGRVCGHVLAKVDGYQVEKNFSGFILGRLIIIRPGPSMPWPIIK